MDNTRWEVGLDMIYLSACALFGKLPDRDVVTSMDHLQVYKQAGRHHMRAITCMAVESYSDILEPKLSEAWKYNKTKALKSVFSYAVEREKLFRFLDDKGIWYMPMKGIVMQNQYPKMGMREMVDNDILIDIKRRDEVRLYMEEQGYDVECFGRDCHDIYSQPPLHFELHVYLCNQSTDDNFYSYYVDVKDRLIRGGDQTSAYRFTDEDFYIYTIVHGYKHFAHTGGIGVRMLMDTAVYNLRNRQLDREYLSREFKKLHIYEFEEKVRTLALKVYSPECINIKKEPDLLTEEERAMLDFFIESGSFGNMAEKLRQRLVKTAEDGKITFGSKVKYFFKRLFPTGLYFKENYPFLYKYKVFIPFFWLWRLITKPFTGLGRIIKEIKFISKQK